MSLIRSTKTATTENLCGGYKLTTRGIQDLLAATATDAASVKNYTVSSMCTIDNLTTYKLDPTRNGPQDALVTISAMMGEVFVVDQVQLLTEPEAKEARASLQTLVSLARQIHFPSRKRAEAWNEGFFPGVAKTCRYLGRSPTEAPIAGA